MLTNDSPRFVLLTAMDGEPILLATEHILDVLPVEIRPEHQELDPDCECPQCKDWHSSSSVTTDIMVPCEHGDALERQGWCVRESVEQIAAILGAVKAG